MTPNKKSQTYRDLTNDLEKKLIPINQIYFSDLRLYLMTGGLFNDEEQVDAQIYNIGCDIFEAQEHGESAEDFFGKKPQKMANEILKEFPKISWHKKITYSLYLVSIFWFFQLISDLNSSSGLTINVLAYSLTAVLSLGSSVLFFYVIQRSVYLSTDNWLKKSKVVRFLTLWLVACVFIGLFVVITLFTPKLLTVNIPTPFDSVIIVGLILGAIGLILAKKVQEFYPSIVVILALGLTGLLKRLPVIKNSLTQKEFIYVTIGIILVSYIIYLFLTRKMIKKQTQDSE